MMRRLTPVVLISLLCNADAFAVENPVKRVVRWLHQANRDVLKNHPRSDESRPLTGVLYTRSPARPNPLGQHPVTVREIDGTRVKIGPIEVFDGTPVIDIKSASTRADG